MQKILFTAIVAGCLAGIFVFAVQSFKLTPLILEAEVYEDADAAKKEAAEAASAAAMGMEHHQHEEEAWEPANGFERNAYRFVADLGVGVGFALMLVGAFSLRGEPMDVQPRRIMGTCRICRLLPRPWFRPAAGAARDHGGSAHRAADMVDIHCIGHRLRALCHCLWPLQCVQGRRTCHHGFAAYHRCAETAAGRCRADRAQRRIRRGVACAPGAVLGGARRA